MKLNGTIYSRHHVYKHVTLGEVMVNFCYQYTGMILVTPVGQLQGKFVYPTDLSS